MTADRMQALEFVTGCFHSFNIASINTLIINSKLEDDPLCQILRIIRARLGGGRGG